MLVVVVVVEVALVEVVFSLINYGCNETCFIVIFLSSSSTSMIIKVKSKEKYCSFFFTQLSRAKITTEVFPAFLNKTVGFGGKVDVLQSFSFFGLVGHDSSDSWQEVIERIGLAPSVKFRYYVSASERCRRAITLDLYVAGAPCHFMFT